MSTFVRHRAVPWLAAWTLAIGALAGCSDETLAVQDATTDTDTTPDEADVPPEDTVSGPTCTIGKIKDGQFIAWPDGADAEMVVGYQGYLFVHVQVADFSGILRKPKARMTATCKGQEPSVTSRWRADMSQQEDGSTVSELIELWLFPALRTEFEGQLGSLSVELDQDGEICSASVNVRYVDDELCKHFEDGSLKCVP